MLAIASHIEIDLKRYCLPLLFLVYVNDLPDCIQHSTIRLFADDCILIIGTGQSNLNPTPSFFKKTSIHFSPGPLYGKWSLILTSATQ